MKLEVWKLFHNQVNSSRLMLLYEYRYIRIDYPPIWQTTIYNVHEKTIKDDTVEGTDWLHNWVTEIEDICLYNNNITFLPNISLFVPNLSELYVQGNRLKTLPDLYDVMSLLILEAADNPFRCNSSLCWLRMLSWMRPLNTMLRDQPVCKGPVWDDIWPPRYFDPGVKIS